MASLQNICICRRGEEPVNGQCEKVEVSVLFLSQKQNCTFQKLKIYEISKNIPYMYIPWSKLRGCPLPYGIKFS